VRVGEREAQSGRTEVERGADHTFIAASAPDTRGW
jgi:hypothetical protein